MAADHRAAITEALQPDLPMRLLRQDRDRGLRLYAGLWALWWTGVSVDGTRGAPLVCEVTRRRPRRPEGGTGHRYRYR